MLGYQELEVFVMKYVNDESVAAPEPAPAPAAAIEATPAAATDDAAAGASIRASLSQRSHLRLTEADAAAETAPSKKRATQRPECLGSYFVTVTCACTAYTAQISIDKEVVLWFVCVCLVLSKRCH